MEIAFAKQGNTLIAAIRGRLDTIVAKQAEEQLLSGIGDECRRLVVDLSPTDYISSAGLRVLFVLARKLKQLDGRFALCGANPQNYQVLDMTGFLSIMTYHDSLDDAIADA